MLHSYQTNRCQTRGDTQIALRVFVYLVFQESIAISYRLWYNKIMSTEVPVRIVTSDYDDQLDRLSNQAGSYEVAQAWMGDAPDASVSPTWAELEADKEVPASAKLSPARRRQIARAAVGPQYGDDALPVVDQTRTPEGYDALRQQVRPVADKLFEERIQRARIQAIEDGTNPGAVERSMREKRMKRRSE